MWSSSYKNKSTKYIVDHYPNYNKFNDIIVITPAMSPKSFIHLPSTGHMPIPFYVIKNNFRIALSRSSRQEYIGDSSRSWSSYNPFVLSRPIFCIKNVSYILSTFVSTTRDKRHGNNINIKSKRLLKKDYNFQQF